eukprot:TRINITY_DN4340_c0_g1_i1.p1 TRINITY_DN4340_c0_g1~~TRINITY_DN4340_c0_g1_i1.p1  ORF type:complete len:749 (+),score=99.52 TRINITY_DN4340_c0_g1_i1:72-2249(+)
MFSWLVGGEEEQKKEQQPKKAAQQEKQNEQVKVVSGEEKTEKKVEGNETPPVLIKNPWPDTVERPREGTWVCKELSFTIRRSKTPQVNASPDPAWEINDSGEDGRPTLKINDEILPIKSVEETPEFPKPELFQPTWVAIGQNKIHWLQRESPGRILALTQTILGANGSCMGKRTLLFNEISEEEEGKTAVPTDYSSKPFACCVMNQPANVPWKEEKQEKQQQQQQQQDEPSVNITLPKFLQNKALGHSCYAWVISEGWLGASNTPEWFVLHDRKLYHAPTPSAETYEEFNLNNVSVETASMIIGPNRMMQHPLKIKNKSGDLLSLTFYTELERDIWCALIDITTAQMNPNRRIHEERMTVYERLITQVHVAKPVPCVDFRKVPDDLPSCVASGYVIIQVESGGWLSDGWKRRWVTVHDTFYTFRDAKGTDTAGLDVHRLRYSRILKAPQPEHPWVFAVYNPFSPPIHIWCDSKPAFAKWISIFDGAAQNANPDHTTAEVGTSMQPGRPFIGNHGVAVPDGWPSLSHVSESSFRHLISPSGVIGSEDGEAIVQVDGSLAWKDGASGPVMPTHYVVRGKSWNEAKPTALTVSDCLLPESVIPDPEKKMLEGYSLCRVTLKTVPASVQFSLRSEDKHTAYLVLSGTIRVTIFPGSCYSLITPSYPACRAAVFTGALPVNWGQSESPLAYKGGNTVEVAAGKFMFVPIDHFNTITADTDAVFLMCSYKK